MTEGLSYRIDTAVRTTEPQNHHTTTRTTRLVPKYAFTFYRFKIFKNMGLVPSSVPFLCILEIAGKRKRFGDSFRDTFHSAFRIPHSLLLPVVKRRPSNFTSHHIFHGTQDCASLETEGYSFRPPILIKSSLIWRDSFLSRPFSPVSLTLQMQMVSSEKLINFLA